MSLSVGYLQIWHQDIRIVNLSSVSALIKTKDGGNLGVFGVVYLLICNIPLYIPIPKHFINIQPIKEVFEKIYSAVLHFIGKSLY